MTVAAWLNSPLFKNVLCVQTDVLLGGLEQLGDFQLAQPNAVGLHPEIDPGFAIVGGINNQLAHTFFPLIDFMAGLALAAAVILV